MKTPRKFKTQEEIWKFVTEGGVVGYVPNPDIRVGFVNGFLMDIPYNRRSTYNFSHPETWEEYIKPEPEKVKLYSARDALATLLRGHIVFEITECGTERRYKIDKAGELIMKIDNQGDWLNTHLHPSPHQNECYYMKEPNQ